ncbi:bifunctional UDP-N-acetylglucosamine diphosphorylase/glucosamine-1-phosphate N-acetyltransferase GlmU [Lactobacillus sp. DCY120]|uniref:Bifunctional protein GlmU n=1 Tax=Bombilactobacillus apium TaxID=2675299 RepID=A0A850QX03_9LACO|nr:bifunctional UDP-N-acetylglucosamine diphosphorylase/glucosamine-1-phosphate N-acetyltransferase GlmU [Bombilactobacillus apium]NVY96344.1 bifunctional UDP-N-acetylglucosamine diphosphorylase/glucosamine-1-phosphate N-acetyltransferase GlmU [Bombilactobacillus apium]
MSERYIVILAAGQGTRMHSKSYKVLHPVCGKAMVDHVLTQAEQVHAQEIVTVVGCGAEQVEELLQERTQYALQEKQLGTAHAVLQAADLLEAKAGTTLVISGDTPLFTAETIEKLFTYHEQHQAQATVLTAQNEDPFGYGRIIRDENQQVQKIVEQKDASVAEQAVTEINTGVYCFDNQKLFHYLHQVKNDNAQGEYYLPDVIELMQQNQDRVLAYQMADFSESLGVNDRVALAQATKIMQVRINQSHLRAGVTLVAPEQTFIDVDVQIGPDTTIEAGVVLKGQTTIGSDCYITSGSRLVDATVGDQVRIDSSTIEEAEMQAGSNVGPHSHLRPQALIGPQVHIGNFCEVKNATIGARTRLGHLSYVGDATLGSDINVGCGVVFVNYDGVKKYHTHVGNQAFIGSNANLIAPVEIADHAFIAAGSTITADLPERAMGIARARQVNKPDYWDRLPLSQDESWQ